MDIAANFGNDSHELIERLALRDIGKGQDIGHPAEQYIPIIEGFQAWFRDNDLQILASELMVYHPAYKYAGTIDLVCRHEGSAELVVIDVKTGGVFDEAAMQISAYSQALEYLTGDPVSEAWVLQLPRDRPIKWDADKLYEIYKVNDIQEYFDAFDTAHKLRGLLEKEAWSS